MDQLLNHCKVTFKNKNDQVGFKFFFKEKDLIEFLNEKPNGVTIILLEQYDRKTYTFEPIK